MPFASHIARLLRFDDASHVEAMSVSFGTSWAHNNPQLIVFICGLICALCYWFYFKRQPIRWTWQRWTLCGLRSLIISTIVVILADPVVELTYRRPKKAELWILLDRSESMSIRDRLPDQQRTQLEAAIDWSSHLTSLNRTPRIRHTEEPSESSVNDLPTRADYAAAMLSKTSRNVLDRLAVNFDLRVFGFGESAQVESLTKIDSSIPTDTPIDWTTDDRSTAIGDTFRELSQKYGVDRLAGAVVVSDFNQNTGIPAVDAAKKLGVPVFTLGVGPVSAVDLSIELQVPSAIKRGESASVTATVRQQQTDESSVNVRLSLSPLGQSTNDASASLRLGEKPLLVEGDSASIDFNFIPESSGRFSLTAEVDSISGEVITQNNRATREIKVIDDFLRLLFVEHEPTWEWRFIKEVFHRDQLVGAKGFRTYLKSADPIVRETNELFLPTLTMPRKQFFENDILFLGDLPAGSLNKPFCDMTKEFVGQFGGGLVVIVGPRFGTASLLDTSLAEMLPVVLDPSNRRDDSEEFRPVITPLASQFDFMRLGNSEPDQSSGWNQLGKLNWYQPVRRVEVRGTTVLAEHPTETCVDGNTKQPLIAIRKYGRGEVVWIAFNELWRLRRLRGEEYYRQFWGQLIHRLGLSHALGHHKRFVVQTDKTEYRLNDQATITIEAYDDDFQPLDESKLPQGRLAAELALPSQSAVTERIDRPIFIPQRKPGQFETQISLTMLGQYQIRITDPISKERTEVSIDVVDRSIERQTPDRNELLQRNLAIETGGQSHDLLSFDRFPDEFVPTPTSEASIELTPLWNNTLVFGIVLLLMTCEWVGRKMLNLI